MSREARETYQCPQNAIQIWAKASSGIVRADDTIKTVITLDTQRSLSTNSHRSIIFGLLTSLKGWFSQVQSFPEG
jgi:hypothetical protein